MDLCNSPGHRLAVGTFHSVALSQIKRFTKTYPRLLDDGARRALLRRCYSQHNPEIQFDDVVAAIDNAKSKITPPSFSDTEIEDIFQEYELVLKSENAMDFSDILLSAVRMMRDGSIPALPIRWLLVDEAQDMDEVQREWILFHGKQGIEVTLVGDDDQSLYSFRNALGYQGLLDITTALSSSSMTLPVNYRCPPNILDHAARLIQYNKDRAQKQISAHKSELGELHVIRGSDREDEFKYLTKHIQANPSGWAVLGRTNLMLDDVETAFVESGIRYARTDSKSIWERSIGCDLLGLMRSVSNGSWTGIANVLVRFGMSPSLVNQHSKKTSDLNHQCEERLAALKQTMCNGAESDVASIIESLEENFTSWRKHADKKRTALVVRGIVAFLAPTCTRERQKKLLASLGESLAKTPGSLSQIVAMIGSNLSNEVDHPVQIMTLHSAKGLEFDNVWIVGVEEGNMPHSDSSEEDERRLLYVGMTRAKERLFLSSSIADGLESRFLSEAGLIGGE